MHWAGWETTTYNLQQAGWQISAEQNVFSNSIRLAMKHDGANMRAISDTVDFPYYEAVERFYEVLPRILIHMRLMGRDVWVHEHGRVDWSFQPIDATPTMTENRISRIEDLAHFAAPLVRTKEIIIPNESVPELLDRILKLQQPARTERIKEEMRSPEGLVVAPKQNFHAQIISLAA